MKEHQASERLSTFPKVTQLPFLFLKTKENKNSIWELNSMKGREKKVFDSKTKFII